MGFDLKSWYCFCLTKLIHSYTLNIYVTTLICIWKNIFDCIFLVWKQRYVLGQKTIGWSSIPSIYLDRTLQVNFFVHSTKHYSFLLMRQIKSIKKLIPRIRMNTITKLLNNKPSAALSDWEFKISISLPLP